MAHLYLVATPIGNREDITLRALRVLSEADFILAEDTRVSKKLIDFHAIATPLISWHQHSTPREWERIKALLREGKNVAVITDAGTPGVSDPGGKLVSLVREELPEVLIVPIPGASALTVALSIAGIPLEEFHFMGFLPHKKGRQTKLKRIAESDWPVVLYESVHRIEKLLRELAVTDKSVIVFRELTKQFETVYRGKAKDVVIPSAEKKGEFVVIVY